MAGRKVARTALKPPDAAVLAYRATLRARVAAFRQRALALVEREWAVRADASDHVRRIARGLDVIVEAELGPGKTTVAVNTVAKRVDKKSKEAIKRVVPVAIRTEQGVPAALNTFRRQNVGFIKTLGHKEVDRLIPILEQAEGSGMLVTDLRKKLIEEFDITKSKADLLARDQTLKLAGQVNSMRQQNAGIESYTWSTSDDERVRPYHQELEGTQHFWDAPPIVSQDGRREHPGGDFQCRCIAIPIIPDYGELDDAAGADLGADDL